ncbi:MAG: oligopeptide:H+ symporter [Clostridiales Family XIII bacterium]|nr:oligopeptide:H+ symporter [Clostridiales Family XIII bacterium]
MKLRGNGGKQGSELTFFGNPLGLLNIFSTEFCERFSYYGMRAILVYYIYDSVSKGGLGLQEKDAMVIMSLFGSLVYLSCIMGGWMADRVLGAYRAILVGCVFIAVGHVILGAPLGIEGVYTAMIFIIVGTGLLKTNVSVMVGNLYERDDPRRLSGFSLLYMSINIGAFLSPIIVGSIADKDGYKAGFLIPAIFMGIGLFVYVGLSKHTLEGIGREPVQPLTQADKKRWRRIFVIAVVACLVIAANIAIFAALGRPVSIGAVSDFLPIACAIIAIALFFFIIRDRNVSGEERGRMKAYIPLFIAATFFFSISEQQSSTIAVVAKQYLNTDILGFHIPASWFQSVNPLAIIALSPVFAVIWSKLGVRAPSMVVKMGVGLAIAGLGLVVLATGFFMRASDNELLNPAWLIAALVIITVGELFLAPTGLSATTLLAPEIHIAKVMGLWFISNALGQAINTVTVRFFDGKQPEEYFLIYAAVAMAVAATVLLMRRKLLALASGVR